MPLTQVFVSISDPRSARRTRHDLAELLTVAVCAVLSGVDDLVDIELWAEAKLDWLREFMKLEHGIPSHDTIGRVFGMIAPDEFESAFRRWVGMVVPALAEDAGVRCELHRTHTEAFKRSLIEACNEPGASIAGVALANGINANQLHRWMRERGIEPPELPRIEIYHGKPPANPSCPDLLAR